MEKIFNARCLHSCKQGVFEIHALCKAPNREVAKKLLLDEVQLSTVIISTPRAHKNDDPKDIGPEDIFRKLPRKVYVISTSFKNTWAK